jgi:hypothetical protein
VGTYLETLEKLSPEAWQKELGVLSPNAAQCISQRNQALPVHEAGNEQATSTSTWQSCGDGDLIGASEEGQPLLIRESACPDYGKCAVQMGKWATVAVVLACAIVISGLQA